MGYWMCYDLLFWLLKNVKCDGFGFNSLIVLLIGIHEKLNWTVLNTATELHSVSSQSGLLGAPSDLKDQDVYWFMVPTYYIVVCTYCFMFVSNSISTDIFYSI